MGIHSSLTCFPRSGICVLFYSTFMLKAGTSLVFPGDSVVKNLPANAGETGDSGLIPGLGRAFGIGNGNTLQYSKEPGGLQSMASQRVRHD